MLDRNPLAVFRTDASFVYLAGASARCGSCETPAISSKTSSR